MDYQTIMRLYRKATKERFALGAFNFSDSITARGIADAAASLRAPVIMSTSEGEQKVIAPELARYTVDGLQKKHRMKIILHLDHGKSLKSIKESIRTGYDSVHMDGSALAYKENLRITKQAVRYAHQRNIFIEGELGHIEGGSTLHKKRTYRDALKNSAFTNPAQAREFIEKTGVDSLAVNVGNVHGLWKGTPHIDFPRLKEIIKLTNIFTVLHGGSGIPQDQIKKAIRIGIDKVNINSEMRIAYTNALRKQLRRKNQFVPREFLPFSQAAVTKVVLQKISLFNAKNKALNAKSIIQAQKIKTFKDSE